MLSLIVYVLSALAVLDVVLTRRRLTQDEYAGNTSASHSVVNLHTLAGGAGIVLWIVFLVSGADLVGIIGLGLLWVTTILGLLLLMRWLPSKGRHAGSGPTDSWSEGPWLSVLAHVGMLIGVAIFTVAYLTHAV